MYGILSESNSQIKSLVVIYTSQDIGSGVRSKSYEGNEVFIGTWVDIRFGDRW